MKIETIIKGCATVITLIILSLFLACNDSKARDQIVKSCNELNSDENGCRIAKQGDDQRCYYDNGSCMTMKSIYASFAGCGSYKSAAKCGQHIECKYNAATWQCENAPNEECANITEETACNTTYGLKSSYKCEWQNSACKKWSPNKYYAFNFDVLEAASTHKFPDSEISGVAASKNHRYLYVLKGAKNKKCSIASSPDNGLSWAEVDHLNERGKPSDNADPVDFKSVGLIDVYEPLENGLAISKKKVGFAIIDGQEVAQYAGWQRPIAHMGGANRAIITFYEAKHNNDRYLYASAAHPGLKSIAFKALPTPFETKADWTSNRWSEGLEAHLGGPLTQTYTAIGQDNFSRLLLGSKKGILLVSAEDVGVDGAQLSSLEDAPSAQMSPRALSLDRGITPNDQGVNAISLVDNKYLLIGFEGGTENKGGLVIKNMLNESENPQTFGTTADLGAPSSMSIRKIIVSADNKAALILSDLGLMYFNDGLLIEIAPGIKLMDETIANAPSNRASFVDKNSAKNGFAGNLVSSDFLGAGEDLNGIWYIGSKSGVITLEIEKKDL